MRPAATLKSNAGMPIQNSTFRSPLGTGRSALASGNRAAARNGYRAALIAPQASRTPAECASPGPLVASGDPQCYGVRDSNADPQGGVSGRSHHKRVTSGLPEGGIDRLVEDAPAGTQCHAENQAAQECHDAFTNATSDRECGGQPHQAGEQASDRPAGEGGILAGGDPLGDGQLCEDFVREWRIVLLQFGRNHEVLAVVRGDMSGTESRDRTESNEQQEVFHDEPRLRPSR